MQPVLRPADYSLPFCPTVDASDLAVGATLFQVFEYIEHPVCFYSKKLDIKSITRQLRKRLLVWFSLSDILVYILGQGLSPYTQTISPLLFCSGWPTTIRNCCVGVWNFNSITLALCIVLVKTICCLTYWAERQFLSSVWCIWYIAMSNAYRLAWYTEKLS